MLDLRLYRAAFLPALLALVVVAFSLEGTDRAVTATIAADAFEGPQAMQVLEEAARRYPDRRPGSAGDEGLARQVRDTFRSTGMRVSERRFAAQTIDGERELTTMVGIRPGNVSSRRIIVLAHRDAAQRGSTAALTGTAGLLELARVFSGRALRKTLVLASTSGGSGGDAGARELAASPGGPVETVLVLGDLGGREPRSPQAVPWSDSRGIASLTLQRTVESSVRAEGGLRPRPPSWASQWARLAAPLTVGEQGVVAAEGPPAILLSVSGERGPGGAAAVDPARFERYGRAALRTISALDNRRGGAALAPRESIVSGRNALPGWAVSLLAGTFLLPVVVAAVDGFARANRRRQPTLRWLAWVLLSAVPLLLAAVLALLLAAVGLLRAAPAAPVPDGDLPFGAAGAACLVLVALAFAGAWLWLRPRLARALGAPFPAEAPGDAPGASAAIALVLALLGAAVWAANPWALVLLLPALHLWLIVVAPEVRMRQPLAVALVALGAVPAVLLAAYFARQFGYDPAELLWQGFVLVAGGGVGAGTLLACAVLAAAAACVVRVALGQRGLPADREPIVTRGPGKYAGPGSLGGTESALRR